MIKIDSAELNKFSIYLSKKAVKDEKTIQKLLKNAGMNIEKGAKQNLHNNKIVTIKKPCHYWQGFFIFLIYIL